MHQYNKIEGHPVDNHHNTKVLINIAAFKTSQLRVFPALMELQDNVCFY